MFVDFYFKTKEKERQHEIFKKKAVWDLLKKLKKEKVTNSQKRHLKDSIVLRALLFWKDEHPPLSEDCTTCRCYF